ncbi:hypothetical protein SBOR_0731 [Sclerotinia borealis F-4128]|uniref:WSC domain-containing protein n=1 Tax=Sclerotinia borealis (strain F-4128) TaxID=1432307 RepID=W9CS08_SCLBF|nr:hypothetical protein SBOR_0731 [Sclerotinia borealis F-4128]
MRSFHAIFVVAFALTATCMTIQLQDEATNIEKRASWTSLGCYADNVSGRALTTGGTISGGSNAMTNEACQSACSAAGFSYAGTEYAGECWCGNSIINGNGPAADGNAGCNMACKGNSAETCGGPNRLTVFQNGGSGSGTTPSSPTNPTYPSKSGKRGLAYNKNNPFGDASLGNLLKGYSKITWGYDWGFPSYSLDSSIEFVPMLWGLPSILDQSWVTAVAAAKNILGFNEPDLTYSESSNMLPAAAAAGYKSYVETYAGQARIGTPGVLWNNWNSVSKPHFFSQDSIQVLLDMLSPSSLSTFQTYVLTRPKYSSGGSYSSRVWMDYFVGNCTGCRLDFAAIHYYQDCFPASGQSGSDWFIANVTNAHDTLKLPIWITEFQCYGSDAQQAQFLQTVLPWLDSQSWVERYAYFGVFPKFLLNEAGTGLSLAGQAYVS